MQPKRKEDPFQKLADSFGTLLDEPLITAIANDYDLTTKDGFASAKSILDGLAQHVPLEEVSSLSPSDILLSRNSTSRGTNDTHSATSATSISHHVSAAQQTDSSNSEDSPSWVDTVWEAPRVTVFNNNSDEDKSLQLRAMFPELKEFDVDYAYKKCNGDFQSALDHLLNLQYLEDTGQQMKGVDGFAQVSQPQQPKKQKGKGNIGKGRKGPSRPDSVGTVLARSTKKANEAGQTEIGYIAERFNLPFDVVSETYYDRNCSSGATVVEILDQRLSQTPSVATDKDTTDAVNVLCRKYRHAPTKYLQGIVHATSSISPFSDDLASLVNNFFSRKTKGQRIDIAYSLAPLPPTGDTEDATVFRKPPFPIGGAWGSGSSSEAIQSSQLFEHARREASEAASKMYKKGASNPLYRQAASYYAEQARDHARSAQAAVSAAADLLVEEQSSGRKIDLHGVSAQDGTRIARQRASDWWQGLGEYRSQAAKARPLVIVTGIGRHSAGGVSPLRRAVAAALIQDGWKVEAGTGEFIIRGRR